MADRDPHQIKRDIANLAALNRDARDHLAAARLTPNQTAAIRHTMRTRQATIDRYLDELLETARG